MAPCLDEEGCAQILESLSGIDEKALLRFQTGTECHDHSREIVARSRLNCLNNMTDGAVYGRKLWKFA